jgi:hypothetical protein
MPRVPVVVALLVAVVALLLAPAALAQEATPEPIRGRTLAAGSVELLESGAANVALGRIVLEPGGSVPFDPADPEALLVYMQAGTLTFRIEAPITVARNPQPGTPTAEEREEFAANTEFTMSEGDSALFPPALAGEVRNDGDEEATVWVVGFAFQPTSLGTPTP